MSQGTHRQVACNMARDMSQQQLPPLATWHVPAGTVEGSARGAVLTVARLCTAHAIRVARTVLAAALPPVARVAETFACGQTRQKEL